MRNYLREVIRAEVRRGLSEQARPDDAARERRAADGERAAAER